MRTCDLCGAVINPDSEKCPRCGFELQKVVKDDVRDRAILESREGQSLRSVKRDLRDSQSRLAAYLENIAAKNLSREEMASLSDDALAFLKIPLVMDVDDELRINRAEADFLRLLVQGMEAAETTEGMPVGTVSAYVRLANALHSMGEPDRALLMVDKALLINPRSRDAMLCRGKLLFHSKRYSAAMKCLEKLVALGDEEAKFLAELIGQISG